jgi:hypothetical protein
MYASTRKCVEHISERKIYSSPERVAVIIISSRIGALSVLRVLSVHR